MIDARPMPAQDVRSVCLFRLATDVRPAPDAGPRETLAFLFFLAQYDIDVRTGAARIVYTGPSRPTWE